MPESGEGEGEGGPQPFAIEVVNFVTGDQAAAIARLTGGD